MSGSYDYHTPNLFLPKLMYDSIIQYLLKIQTPKLIFNHVFVIFPHRTSHWWVINCIHWTFLRSTHLSPTSFVAPCYPSQDHQHIWLHYSYLFKSVHVLMRFTELYGIFLKFSLVLIIQSFSALMLPIALWHDHMPDPSLQHSLKLNSMISSLATLGFYSSHEDAIKYSIFEFE